ncbi:pyruvate dehydrogenase phosphatase regulatory subunit, mitochondrial isoform X2 [Nematostella vectensis]|nr:pyruvate dehydrogenase phosphatase regulatory subunit, mitochondrial isoform X2 [Nematostella vectensis]XP_048576598.1 pyruvate dehydrogenase phosphatase regulatory subunit, mitochondrial isoform X2 [Nematostella vectensis]
MWRAAQLRPRAVTCAYATSSDRTLKLLGITSVQTHNRQQSTSADLPTQAQIVIGGGGVWGCSVAYHLAKEGWKDIVLLEQGSLSGGTTWHAAGILGKLRGTEVETRISDYAATCYSQLERETGQETGFKKCGGLLLARTRDRFTLLKRMLVKARAFGIELDLISPEEAKEKFPFMRADDVKGALWLPDEGVISPSDLCSSFGKGATLNGVKIHQKTAIAEVLTDGRDVTGVRTDKGDISCQIFVNCAGMWARQLGLKCASPVHIPLHPVEHFYIITQPIGASHMLPMLRDPDGHVYFREWGGGICAGGLEPIAKPVFTQGVPRHFEFQLFQEDWDQFECLMGEIIHRIPEMERTEIRQMVNGPESFTPDGRCIMGEAPNVRNYFVAAGACTNGIANAAGVGRLLSEWITKGRPPLNVSCLDIKRFSHHHNNLSYLRERIRGMVGYQYSIPYPRRECSFARPLKCPVLYTLLDEAGASWGERMGWETPNWFRIGSEDNNSKTLGTFGRPPWLANVEQEYRACKEGVGLVDLTSTGILEIKSQDVHGCVDLLQKLCIDDADIPINGVLHTAMLNHDGGFELQCTLVRTHPNRFLLLAKPSYLVRAISWVTRHAADDVTVTDLQSNCSILGVLGPTSRDLMQPLTQTPLGIEEFPVDTCQVIDIDFACDVTLIYSSQLAASNDGWLLLVPNDQVTTLYRKLKNCGARDVGWYAVDAITEEKGMPGLGAEIHPWITPLEAGLDSADKKLEFYGKDALAKKRDKPLTKRLAFVKVKQNDDDYFPWGGETIVHNGDVIGMVTSSVYSFAQGRPVCFALVEKDGEEITADFLQGKRLQMNIAGQMFDVEADFVKHQALS